jgi:hypothetical protein
MVMAQTALSRPRTTLAATLDGLVDEVRLLATPRQLVDPAMVAAARALSVNTVCAFLSDLRVWDRWCRLSGVQTGAATAQTVASYVRALSGEDVASAAARALEVRSAATIARYLVHIGWAYRMAGRDDPVANSLVRLELKAARKKVGTAQVQVLAIRFKGDVTDLDGPARGICLAR